MVGQDRNRPAQKRPAVWAQTPTGPKRPGTINRYFPGVNITKQMTNLSEASRQEPRSG